MAKYKAYPEYKDSGVEWLGKIPTHWICTQIKYGYDITLGKMLQKNKSSSKDELKPYLKAQNIQPKGIDLSVVDNMWFSPDEKNKLLLKNNDVLISEGGDVGRSALWQGQLVECYIQNAINRARAIKGNSPYFLNYWMVYLKSADFINTLCNKATIPHYTAEKVETSPLLLPNCDEQLHISLFLDHETAKIDNLIEKQQQLIELLKEKRQAVISHAVTKGLNPDVQMKDSGVEWLGDVPAHWEVKRIKHFGKVIGGFAFKSTDFTDEGYPVIKISNVSHLSFDWGDSSFLPPSFSFTHKEYLAPNGALVFAMTRPVISGGIKVTLLDDDSAPLVNQRVGFMMVRSKNMARYILISTQSSAFLAHYVNNMTVTNQPNISSEGIESIYLPVPPMNEISRILLYVDRMNESYNQLIDKALLQVSLLQERRTALISAAVTGKIDVRDWVAPDTQDIEASQEAIA
ncbi:type I restriction modification DNA specificity domain protein [Enterobacter roggenkampii]|uniref:restriction endonuclease subunit S n=1 Tax=Enterobacter roggenkampii TaxID=1812935 RepID=UPI000D0461E5|nr:restriction endonuclease subunit S [Enterobacter roggenkampii]EKY3999648.1 restriction endonuclease subunit S [Enterobacter roggenkampii]PRW44067.1 type I restriction modification DNA specificity domain protein [Enterobacter roggenkampii]QLV13724.1 restriction endonuclease subunit S [Enterobacter roggenkampii]